MSLPLSSSTESGMRKDLVRLRMEMHRQQLLYNAQPLSHPMEYAKGLLSSRQQRSAQSGGKGPVMIAASVALALFGRRLGRLGKVARIALTLYPLINQQRKKR